MNAPQTDDELLKELVGAYRTAKTGGKFLAFVLIGFLSFIVLLSQAWDIVKLKIGFH